MFIGVEQGSEWFKDKIYLLMIPRFRREVQQQIRENLEIKLIFTNKKERKCLVELKLINDNVYNNKLNRIVTSILTK